jgi:hypothetical protein
MKRRFAVLAGLGLLFQAAAFAQGTGVVGNGGGGQAQPAGVKLDFERKRHGFGRVISGAVIEWAYVFTNRGAGAVEIPEVSATNPLVEVRPWSRQVRAGGQGIIPVKLMTTNMTGKVEAVIRATCVGAGQEREVVELALVGQVTPPVVLSQGSLVLRPVLGGKSNACEVVRVLNLRNEGDQAGACV